MRKRMSTRQQVVVGRFDRDSLPGNEVPFDTIESFFERTPKSFAKRLQMLLHAVIHGNPTVDFFVSGCHVITEQLMICCRIFDHNLLQRELEYGRRSHGIKSSVSAFE